MRKPELLAPAGDMERLRMAVLYGADAVYLAGTSFGMRSFAGNFSPEELPEAVAFAHAHGVRVHVTVNTMPRGPSFCFLFVQKTPEGFPHTARLQPQFQTILYTLHKEYHCLLHIFLPGFPHCFCPLHH